MIFWSGERGNYFKTKYTPLDIEIRKFVFAIIAQLLTSTYYT